AGHHWGTSSSHTWTSIRSTWQTNRSYGKWISRSSDLCVPVPMPRHSALPNTAISSSFSCFLMLWHQISHGVASQLQHHSSCWSMVVMHSRSNCHLQPTTNYD